MWTDYVIVQQIILANRSTKGAFDGADWYVLHVTTSTKNMLKGTANYGWKIHDTGLTSSSTTYRSSDYASPYKPELVIDHTSSTTPPSTNYGSRGYESSTGDGQNCMGYALDIQKFINYKILFGSPYATSTDWTAVNQSKNYTALMTVVERVMRRYMNDKLGYNGYKAISSYNSSIDGNSYRTVMRLGVLDNNDQDGWQLVYSNYDSSFDQWDYHWWYQTKTGQWAEKRGGDPSRKIPGTSASTNPGSSANLSLWDYYYTSGCKYFAIKQNTNN